MSGKTRSLVTFIYGDYDYWSDKEHDLAVQYAAGRKMVILTCPGETGIRSLPPDTEHVKSYYYQTNPDEDVRDVKWSVEALRQYETLSQQVLKQEPDILAVDGIPNLWGHMMNRTTSGEWFGGLDMSINPRTESYDQYRPATFHNRTHAAFLEYISRLNTCSIPVVVMTAAEEFETGSNENPEAKAAGFSNTKPKYLWPAIPGKMAKEVVQKFDARVSCQRVVKCFYGPKSCEDFNNNELHHVWQFLPKEDVAGVGIKGLKVTKAMKIAPYIHPSYEALKQLIEAYK
jgi:hypothetical protein